MTGIAAAAGVVRPAVAEGGDGTDPVVLAQEMLRFDTSHTGQGGVTLPFAEALRAKWTAAGVSTQIIPTPKADNAHLVARVPGQGGKPPLLFMSHSDVVTVERENWQQDPYGGAIVDGWLHGRGAIDMKGAGAAFMAAILRHVKEGATFDRDILYLADADEEGGAYGARWLVDNHYDKVAAGAAITEGGWLLTGPDGMAPMLASLSTRDRTSILTEVSATGAATHSSHPDDGPAITRLGAALTALSRYKPAVRLPALVRDYFTALGQATPDTRFATAIRHLLRAEAQADRDHWGAVVVRLSDHPWIHNSLLRTTFSFVGQRGGYYSSIVPSTAVAEVRIGFVPDGDDPTRFIDDVRTLLSAQGATLRLIGREGDTDTQILARLTSDLSLPASSVDTDVYRHWDAATREVYPGLRTAPSQFEASTSARPWREKGIPVYGLYPYAVDGDTATRMHGNNERVNTDALRQGTEALYRFLARLRV
ncbi:M20/M25/M40 family metallo-hydrolase [Actinokineospora auranticolor]|uniref:M20/M25/M40 family metallo-hydrolase n=1 Tax=Actinokineospora auranticolor TaxID=155976 RepID=UPI0015E2C15C|nr:M20/M25/M40 family metallo-hydrolase [Actinokineospora auranticolor]